MEILNDLGIAYDKIIHFPDFDGWSEADFKQWVKDATEPVTNEYLMDAAKYFKENEIWTGYSVMMNLINE